MIVSFKIKNFRSYADEAELSFVAQPDSYDLGSVTTVKLDDGSSLDLLNSVAIFGANASGKSNVIYALSTLSGMIANSLSYKTSDGIPDWIPYFTPEKNNEPIETSIDFVVESTRFLYSLRLHHGIVDCEELQRYTDGKIELTFKRELNKDDNGIPSGYNLILGAGWKSKTLDLSDMNILGNQLMLSWLATKEANGLQNVSEYLGTLQVYTPSKMTSFGRHLNMVAENIFGFKNPGNHSPIFNRFTKMMSIADLGIVDAYMARHEDSDFQFPSSVPEDVQRAFITENRWELGLIHTIDDKGNRLRLPLNLESQGTQMLVKLVPLLLKALEEGSFIAYDEINTAIHPELLRLLIELFKDPVSNPRGAQLLFTTHEASIAGNNTLRADQIWFAEKKNGRSTLFSAQDFEDVPVKGIPFENWYRAGRFGALPEFGSVGYIFGQDEKKFED